MSNAQELLNEFTAPVREQRDYLRELEAIFKREREYILKIHPGEDVAAFPSLEGIDEKHLNELKILEVICKLAAISVQNRADQLRAEAEEAERVRAETLRQKNMSPLEGRLESLERVVAYQGAKIAKLEGAQPGRQPAPYHARANAPMFLGMPAGMGRHAETGDVKGGADVRRIGAAEVSTTGLDGSHPGFTQKAQPLDAIGSSGKR